MGYGQPNAHIAKRIQKADMILATCKKAFEDEGREDNGVNEKVLISTICLEFGAGSRYVKEIIEDLVNTKKISRVDGKLYYIDSD